MPRSRISRGKLKAEVYTNALIASARDLSTTQKPGPPKKIKPSEWQRTGWHWFRNIDIFHYGIMWIGNIISRATLTVTENGAPTSNADATAALADFFGGPEGQTEFLRMSAIHMSVAGDGYIIGQADGDGDDWMIAAAIKVKSTESGYKYDGNDLPSDALLIRFWRPDPVDPNESDAPTRSMLATLQQLYDLTEYVSAQLDSRLSGNGILIVPQEVTFPTTKTNPDGSVNKESGFAEFLQELNETMEASKKDRNSSAARTPLGMMVPAEFSDAVRHLTLWTPLDEHAKEMRDDVLRRVALGMDMPPEALLGSGDTNHWSAWQIEDSLIKSHSEPLLDLITDAITVGYLQPFLISQGMDEATAATFAIGADTSKMRLRPDRSKESLELNDRLVLSDEAMLRENGFDPSDVMDDKEISRKLLIKMAQGSPSPGLVEAAGRLLGIKLPDTIVDDTRQTDRGTAPNGQDNQTLPPSKENHPVREIPQRPTAPPSPEAAALFAYGEAAVMRALERCGNRIKSTSAKLDGIPAGIPAMDRYRYVALSKEQLNFVLADAWSHLSRLGLPEGVDAEDFQVHLDNYTRMLISSRQPYNPDLLQTYLALVTRAA
jgi:hypothetical protein